jgi:hypothetical protein
MIKLKLMFVTFAVIMICLYSTSGFTQDGLGTPLGTPGCGDSKAKFEVKTGLVMAQAIWVSVRWTATRARFS